MTDPFPMPPEPTLPAGRFARWQLTEPVRLYLFSVAGVVVAGLVLAGVLTREWADFLLPALGVILVVPPVAQVVRSAVYPIAALERAALARVYAIRRRERRP